MNLPERMPDGCNFYGLLKTELDPAAVARRFTAAGWSVSHSGDRERLEIAWGRLSLTGDQPMVLSGWLDQPDEHVNAVLGLLTGREIGGVYQWIRADGSLWREMPFDESMLDPDDTRLPADIKASMLASRAGEALAPQKHKPWWRFW